MKKIVVGAVAALLLIAVFAMPSLTQEGPPTPKQIKKCQKECKDTYKECVRAGEVEEPLCEAAWAFCDECCTGGC